MQDEDRRFVLMGAGLLGLGVAGAVSAGSLNPPPGPVAPTGKPLTDIEPRIAVQSLAGDATSVFLISQPGSYYLTGNITGVSGKDAVRITASDVSLDLCGFGIAGPGNSGINQAVGTRARILNGLVGSLSGNAINVGAASVVSDVVVRSVPGVGIAAGAQSRIERCSVQGAGIGIQLSSGGTVQGCRVDTSATTGISVGPGSRVSHCDVNNTGTGVSATASAATNSTVITDCYVANATVDGINVASSGSVVERCAVSSCSTGIRVFGTQSRVALNQVTLCPTGINLSASSGIALVVQNTVYGSSSTAISAPASAQVGPVLSAGAIAAATSPWANFTS